MSFPFYWIGAVVAGLILAGALTIFGLGLKVVTRATNDVRGSILPGLVSGFREWAANREDVGDSRVSRSESDHSYVIEDITTQNGPPVERVGANVL